ncbi:MAG: heme lyase CcmF/NrfE family subunit [Proteobacteria bacterium]|nr:heme lyase CcmF/NrfE family subunit [Pseudomonadota bacterium]
MTPEIGHYALVLALLLAAAQALFGLLGPVLAQQRYVQAVPFAVAGQFVFTALAMACLVNALVQMDFSVRYVAENANSALPLFYRVAAVWGAHEGSLLLWILVLSVWTVAVTLRSRALPQRFIARVLGIMGLLSVGFLLFTLATSNPFLRLDPAAPDGRDLNPVLQDFALAIHPPMLYIGYVGLSVAFAFACAAMIEGQLDQAWARWTRPWTTLAWAFLTAGIALGSWWAYYELGWGGFWFWDPVENASFMPWLVATALIHSLAVTDKRGLFKSWTLLLAISGFSLSLLGTFLVRSGVLVSVHSFAADPARGVFILAFLVIVIGGALTLYAWRAPGLRSSAGFELTSRESFLLFNNILLVIAAAVIFGGTMAPMVSDALGQGALSVGPQYFNPTFLLPTLPLLALVSVGMHASWKRGNLSRTQRPVLATLALAVALALAVWMGAYGTGSLMLPVGLGLGLWIILSSLVDPIDRLRRGLSLSAGVLGMSIAHIGLGLLTLGIAVVQTASIERDSALVVGQSAQLGAYSFRFDGVEPAEGANFNATQAKVTVQRDGVDVAVLQPQKRTYWVQRNAMTEAAIKTQWNQDLFVAMGEDVGKGAWSLRMQVRPLIQFVWFGAIIMMLGGIIAGLDRRYRQLKPVAEQEPNTVDVAAGARTA